MYYTATKDIYDRKEQIRKYVPISDADNHCTCMCDMFLYFIKYSWSNFPSRAEMSASATESLLPIVRTYVRENRKENTIKIKMN